MYSLVIAAGDVLAVFAGRTSYTTSCCQHLKQSMPGKADSSELRWVNPVGDARR
jgi:hypothetical protein